MNGSEIVLSRNGVQSSCTTTYMGLADDFRIAEPLAVEGQKKEAPTMTAMRRGQGSEA